MGDLQPQPRVWRLILGFVTAPWPMAMLYAWWAASLDGRISVAKLALYFAGASGVAYLPILLLGLPMHFALRRRLRPRLVWMVLCGVIISVVAMLAVMFIVQHGAHLDLNLVSVKVSSPSAGGLTSDWITLLIGFIPIASLGAIGGLTFWLAAICGDGRLKPTARA